MAPILLIGLRLSTLYRKKIKTAKMVVLTCIASADSLQALIISRGGVMYEKPKRGRPFLPEGEGSRVNLNVRIPEDDKLEIDRAASLSGVSASKIIRAGSLKEARRLARRGKRS